MLPEPYANPSDAPDGAADGAIQLLHKELSPFPDPDRKLYELPTWYLVNCLQLTRYPREGKRWVYVETYHGTFLQPSLAANKFKY
jgi:hypothetical protein